MAAPSARLQSLMNTALLPGAIGNVILYSPVTLRLIGKALPWPAGSRLERPFKYKSTGQGGAFSGLQEFSVTDVATSIKLTYDIAGYQHGVVVPGIEKLLNDASDAQITNLVAYKTEEAKTEIIDGIAQLFFGNSNADFVSIRDYADDGGQTANIGGQVRSTYTALQGVDTASGGALALTEIRTLISAVARGSLLGPSMAISNETVWDFVESLFTPALRANYEAFGRPKLTLAERAPVRAGDLMGVYGYDALVYAGVPFVKDERSTAQSLFMVNEDFMAWYGKRDPDLKAVDLGGGDALKTPYHVAPSKFHGFNWKELELSQNQYAWVGRVFLFGQLVSFDPARQGVLTGITGV